MAMSVYFWAFFPHFLLLGTIWELVLWVFSQNTMYFCEKLNESPFFDEASYYFYIIRSIAYGMWQS